MTVVNIILMMMSGKSSLDRDWYFCSRSGNEMAVLATYKNPQVAESES
jgi:hypothetical protein